MSNKNYKEKSRPILTRSDEVSNGLQNDESSKEDLIINWQDEIRQFWCKIKEQTKSSLMLIKQDRIRKGLAFDEIFKNNFLRSANSKICSAYDEFLEDQTIERFSDNTDTEQQDQIILECHEPKSVITHRQSKRIAERHTKFTNRSSTPETQNSTEKSIVRVKHSISQSSKCNDQTPKQMNIPESREKSLPIQQRMELDRTTKQKLPDNKLTDTREELNISRHSAANNFNGKIMADEDSMVISTFGDERTMPLVTNTEPNSQNSFDSGRETKHRPIIILSDFNDLPKSSLYQK